MKETTQRRTRGIRRYRELREAGLCTLCRAPVEDGKICCLTCREKRKKPRPGAPIRTTCFAGTMCIIPLSEVLEVLRLRINYHPDHFEFTGSQNFTADRLNITPFDVLRSRGLIGIEAFEAKVAAHRNKGKN